MKYNEIIFEDNNHTGQIVYHGTALSFLPSIFKVGLSPRINKYEKMWAEKYGYEYDLEKAKQNKALYVTTDIDTAKRFGAGSTSGYKDRNYAVLAFKILPTDIVDDADSGPGFIDSELLIRNTISPDRLHIVYPENISKSDIENKANKLKSKTNIIRSINKIINDPNWVIRSGSNKSDLLHIKSKKSGIRLASVKLKNLIDFLSKEHEVEDWVEDENGKWIEHPIHISVTPDKLNKIKQLFDNI